MVLAMKVRRFHFQRCAHRIRIRERGCWMRQGSGRMSANRKLSGF